MTDEKPVFSESVDKWFMDVRDELGITRQTERTMLEVAAHAMLRTNRTTQPDPADLRLVLDTLAVLRTRPRRWFW